MSQETPNAFQAPQNMTRPMGPLLIGERTEHVPEWCPWRYITESAWRGDQEAQRKLLSTHVWVGPDEIHATFIESCGKPITVAQVLPERRFAIRADGRLKDQQEFVEELKTKFVETYAIAGERLAADPNVIPQPDVREFVQWGEDPSDRKKRAKINYDPFAPPPANVKRRTAEDATNDPIVDNPQRLRPAPDGVTNTDRLTGRLVDEDGKAMIDIHSEPSMRQAGGDMERAKQMLDAGAISVGEYKDALRKIAVNAGWVSADGSSDAPKIAEEGDGAGAVGGVHGTDAATPGEATPSSAPLFASLAACGKVFDGKKTQKLADHAVRMHKRHCQTCKDHDARE